MNLNVEEGLQCSLGVAQRIVSRTPRRMLLACLFAFLFLALYLVYHSDMSLVDGSTFETQVQFRAPVVAKISMLYGATNPYYERAVDSHERHAARFGYPVHLLRHSVATGYWNKPSYILSILIQELSKDSSQRTEWMMWFDGDSIILNPALRIEVFLPPQDFDYMNFLVAKDQNGMNTGIFFIRVCEWSIRLVAKALAYPLFNSEVDLGWSADQMAMQLVCNETEFRDGVLYQPRIWYNTYEFHHGYEGKPGALLVHFPGMEQDRWEHMSNWLGVVEGNEAAKWEMPFLETNYPDAINRFWSQVRECKRTLGAAEDHIRNDGAIAENLEVAISNLREVLRYGTDNSDQMAEAVNMVNRALNFKKM